MASQITPTGDTNLTFIRRPRAFDVELIYIAERLRIPTGEVAVRWTEIEGGCRKLRQSDT